MGESAWGVLVCWGLVVSGTDGPTNHKALGRRIRQACVPQPARSRPGRRPGKHTHTHIHTIYTYIHTNQHEINTDRGRREAGEGVAQHGEGLLAFGEARGEVPAVRVLEELVDDHLFGGGEGWGWVMVSVLCHGASVIAVAVVWFVVCT